MTLAWVLWYGLRIGLTRSEVMNTRFGEMLDLIAIEQIKREGAVRKKTQEEEVDNFFRLLQKR